MNMRSINPRATAGWARTQINMEAAGCFLHEKKTGPLLLILIALTAIVAYLPALNAPFVLDDPRVVERSLKLRDLSNFLDFTALFKDRPLVNFTFAINYRAGGLDVGAFHAVNLAIHLANVVAVFFLARLVFSMSLSKSRSDEDPSILGLAPFFAAALFALHPIQSQPVIYISQRAALMACLFYLLSIICYMKARSLQIEKQKKYAAWLLLVMCVFFALMAFLSKENAASLPLAVLMMDMMFFSDSWASWKKKLPTMLLLVFLMGLGFAWLAGAFEGDLSGFFQRIDRLTRETDQVSRWQYLCTQFTVILLYLRLIVFPKGLNIDPGYPMKNGFFEGITPIAFAILAGIMILSVVYAKKYKVLSLGVFWFFIALSVESSILPIRDAMFEHRVYLAFPGICIILAYLFCRLLPGNNRIKIGIWGFMMLLCALATFSRGQVWKSDLSLWQDAVKKAPHNARAWNNYGNSLKYQGLDQAAASAYQQSINADPKYSRPYCNLGELYAKKGDLAQAEKLLLHSIHLDPRFAEAHNNLAIVYMSQKNQPKGIKHFEKALDFDPERPITHYNLGKAYLDGNQPDKALEHLLQAVSMKPDLNPMAYYLAGAAWALKGDSKNAAKWVDQARQKGLDNSLEFVKEDPRFDSCRKAVLELVANL